MLPSSQSQSAATTALTAGICELFRVKRLREIPHWWILGRCGPPSSGDPVLVPSLVWRGCFLSFFLHNMMTCVSTLACAALLVALILAAHRLIDAIACAVSRRRLRAKVAAWTPPGVSWIARQQRVVVIVNPNAGAGWGDCVYEDVVRPMLRRAGIEHEVVRTTCAGMAEREAAELASRKVPVDCLLSVSGDGQLHECLNGLRGGGTGGRTALAVVPAGTGNGMSDTCFGRGSDAFEALCSILCASGPTPVDVMRLTYPDEPARTPRHDLHFFCWAAFADHDYVTENGWRWLGPLLKVALAPLYVIAQRRG